MTEDTYITAKHLQERMASIRHIIAIAENKDVEFLLGHNPDPAYYPDTYTAMKFYCCGEDVKEEYKRIGEKAKKELIEFLSSKLDKLKKEFENV